MCGVVNTSDRFRDDVSRKSAHRLRDDFGIRPGSAVPAYLALLAWPIAGLFGLYLAHIPFAIWTQYEEGQGGTPLWFNLLGAALFVAVLWLLRPWPGAATVWGVGAVGVAAFLGSRLGYAEAASFILAFKRWKGVPPSAVRRELGLSARKVRTARSAIQGD